MNHLAKKLLAPTAAVGLLVAMIATNAAGTMRTMPGVDEYFERVATSIQDVPMQSGPWLGIEIPVIPAAQDLLNPNELIQRRYTNAGSGEWFELLIVHCGDVRDMLGHFPPVCYPANGWKLENRTPLTVGFEGREANATRYGFTREIDFVEDRIRIVNLFAVPASRHDPEAATFGADITIADRAGRYRERARMGSAQIQVIIPASIDAARRDEILIAAMGLVGPVLLDVERGPM